MRALSFWEALEARRTPRSWSAGTDTGVSRNGTCQWSHSKGTWKKIKVSTFFSCIEQRNSVKTILISNQRDQDRHKVLIISLLALPASLMTRGASSW